MCDYDTFILVNNHQIATWWKRYLIFLILGKSMNDIVLDKVFNLWPVILQISLICVWKVNLWSILTSHNFKHLLFPNFSFEILWLPVHLHCIADDTYLDWLLFRYNQTIEKAFMTQSQGMLKLLLYRYEICMECYH